MIEVVAILRAFILLALGDFRMDEADIVQPVAQVADERGVLAPALHEDGARAFERGLDVGNAFLRIHERRGDCIRHL